MRIVCLTSNAYLNCVAPFAHYWNQFAGAHYDVMVAGYESQPVHLPENFSFHSIGFQHDHTWSSGLLKLLESLDEEHILLLLEDYFLCEPVDWRVVQSLRHLMSVDHNVVKCDLTDDRLKVPFTSKGFYGIARLIESEADAPFQASVQAAIWRRDFLMHILDPAENAWQFEKQGTKRIIEARRAASDDRFAFVQTMHVMGTLDNPMRYANAVGGAGGKPGVIEARHMPAWMWDECLAKGWADG